MDERKVKLDTRTREEIAREFNDILNDKYTPSWGRQDYSEGVSLDFMRKLVDYGKSERGDE